MPKWIQPTVNPDTGDPESEFRELVREVLGLDWSTRDAVIFAEIHRLKVLEKDFQPTLSGYREGK